MLKLNFLSLLLVLGLFSSAQFTLEGKVTNENGEPLIGASVQLKQTYLGASTNSEGFFKFTKLKSGEYQILISYLGYDSQIEKVHIGNDTELNVKLSAKSLMSEEVIVMASRAKENTPVAQTTLQKDDVRRGNVIADIPYQLELTPSVVATSETGTGSGYSSMRIRGTDISRINVCVNGVPLNDSESQGVYWVNMPDFTESVNSIQIQRGVGTSTNGSAAFGASINFQTLTIEPKPYANLSSSIGSFNTFKENISAGTGLIDNKFAFDVRASKLNSDGYIQRGFSDHGSIYFSGTYYGEKDLLKAIAIFGKQKTGITWWGTPADKLDSERNYNPAGKYYDYNGNEQFYDGQTDNYWQNHYQLLYSREYNKHLNFNATLHTTTGKGYYEQYIPEVDDFWTPNLYSNYGLDNILLTQSSLSVGNETYSFPDSTIRSSDMIRQKWLDNIFYGITANLNYHKNKLDATFGIAANKYDGDHFGKLKWIKFNSNIPQDYEWYKNIGTKTDVSSFAKVQYSLTNELLIFGDIQIRNIQYTMNGPDDDLQLTDQENDWFFINPKFGVNYQINEQQRAYVSFAVANREPARADLKEALKEGGTEVPKHETLNDIEVGYQIKHAKYAFGLNAFYMLYKNQLVNTGEKNSVGYDVMTNVDNSFRRGVELIGGVQILNNLSWNGNLTLSQNRIKDYVEYANYYDADWNKLHEAKAKNLGETNISYSPEIIGASQIRFEPIKNIGFALTSKYVGEQYFDNTSSDARKLDAYFVNNFSFDYLYSFESGQQISFQFFINNIVDVDYISNAYGGYDYLDNKEQTWSYYFPQAGRNYMAKITMRF